MDTITLDLETFFDKGYSLTGMTYPEYIFDDRFLIQGVGIAINDDEVEYYPEHEVDGILDELDIEGSRLVLQNAKFDASILAWKYDRFAASYVDTMDLARCYWPGQDSSLEIICKRLWPDDPSMWKGKELASFKGIRELDDEQQAVMGRYCMQDVFLTRAIYHELIGKIPESELRLAEMTLRMYIEPPFVLDRDRVERYLEHEKQRVKDKVKASGLPKTRLSSNKQFAEWMREQGIDVPQKQSPTTGKMTDALGQKDPVFLRTMADHPDHQPVWEARAAVKSTIGATRAKRLLDLDETLGRIPTPLSFWGAHTGRWSGTQKLNLQNLPRGGELRKSLCAPSGYLVHVADSAQIEARMLAWLAGQTGLLDDFRNKRDIYSKMATKVYGYEVDRKLVDEHGNKPFAEEGNVGKTCLAEGSLVLTPRGWVPIEQITLEDHVWDGVEWVTHSGVVHNGCKPTLNIYGLRLTPDHLILSGTKWKEAQSLVHDAATLSQALETGSANLPLQAMSGALEGESPDCLFSATAIRQASIPSTHKTSRTSNLLDALFVLTRQRSPSVIGSTPEPCLTTAIAHGYSTVCHRPLDVATNPVTGGTPTTAPEASMSIKTGKTIAPRSWNTSKRSPDGMTRILKWIARTTARATSRVTSFFRPVQRTQPTETLSPRCASNSSISKRRMNVYDVTSAGPRNRFTVWTENGPLIVHNCVLGLGYGMGAPKFRATLAAGPMGAPPILVSAEFAQTAVNVYRSDNPMIVHYWGLLNQAMYDMMFRKTDYWIGPIRVRFERLELPNGTALKYPNLRVIEETDADGFKTGRTQVVCDRKGGTTQKLYGGILVENVTQAMARIVVSDQILAAVDAFPDAKLALAVHDEIVMIMPDDNSEERQQQLEELMRIPPTWAPDLPLDSEGGFDISYSK